MPGQMAVLPFNYPSNVDLLDGIRAAQSPEYQRRIPSATKAGVQETMNAMWNYVPGRNEFIDSLINVIGAQIVKYNTWNNPLAKYKRGMLQFGETIEEVAIGLAKAKTYSRERGDLEADIFGIEPSNSQARFHKVNRKDWYKVSVSRMELQRAFFNSGGLSGFVAGLMSQINTSDNVDEFLLMADLPRKVYDQGGFFKMNVPDLLNGGMNLADNAKQFLTVVREMSQRLTFMSEKYNAAHMPRVSRPDELELILTPRAQAVIDVEALSAAFNIDRADINTRTTVIPEENLNIPGAQGILTTRDLFIVADQVLEMQNSNNPVMLHQNYFWHHHEVISASPFENAVLLTTEDGTDVIVVTTPVDGVSAITITDASGGAVAGNNLVRGNAYELSAAATVNNAGAPAGFISYNDAVIFTIDGNKSTRTRVLQNGVLYIAQDDDAASIVVTATSVDDPSFSSTATYNLTGDLVIGGFAVTEDTNTAVISNTAVPKITVPASGPTLGASLTVNNGSWDTRGLTYAYQWHNDGVAIAGATSDTYAITAADQGHTLTATVTASKTGLTSGTATSAGVAVPAA